MQPSIRHRARVSRLGIAAAPRAAGADRRAARGERGATSMKRCCCGERAADYVVRMARAKALAVRAARQGRCRCSLPTPPWWSMRSSAASPPTRPQALAMLGRLSGRTHQVLTAVALVRGRRVTHRLSASEVRFRALSRSRMPRLLGQRRAARQGRRLRRAGTRRGVHRAPERQLLRRHGPAAVRDRPSCSRPRACRTGTAQRAGVLPVSIEILVNVAPRETRAAILENGVVQEMHIERTSRRGLVSNLYKGRVSRVLPGMQAAFVEIGLERTAFLHAADIARSAAEDTLVGRRCAQCAAGGGHPPPGELRRRHPGAGDQGSDRHQGRASHHLHRAALALSGVHAARRGRRRVGAHRGGGRAHAPEGADHRSSALRAPAAATSCARRRRAPPSESLREDMGYLAKLWEHVRARAAQAPPGTVVHEDLPLTLRVLRDELARDVSRVLVDSAARASRACRSSPPPSCRRARR